MKKNEIAIKVFSEFGEKETVNKKWIREIQKFICEVYG